MNSEDLVTLELDQGNKAVIHLHGATLTSWVNNGQEVIFVSEKAVFDNKKAIRGGIPIVFPNFGPWDNGRPQHGFARSKRWSIKTPVSKLNNEVSVSLNLVDDQETRKLWNHGFELVYNVTLSLNKLTTRLEIKNTGDNEFDFTALLHTYFRVNDIAAVKVYDLAGLNYLDKVKGGVKESEERNTVTIGEETDRVYMRTGTAHKLDTGNGVYRLEKENLPDTVLWNPWIEKAKGMADFGDEEYKNMVCLEAGYVSERYALKPGQAVTMSQVILNA